MSQPSESLEKNLSLLRVSWIKSSIILGVVFLIFGLAAILIIKFLDLEGLHFLSEVKDFVNEYGLMGIFLATILAGTVVPLGSPAIVVAAASMGVNPGTLIFVSTAGFTLGMAVNYGLAYGFGRPYVLKKVGERRLNEISALWGRWGWIIYAFFGLLPFLPVEFLSLFCGLIKARFIHFLALTFIPRFFVSAFLVYFGAVLGCWLGIT